MNEIKIILEGNTYFIQKGKEIVAMGTTDDKVSVWKDLEKAQAEADKEANTIAPETPAPPK